MTLNFQTEKQIDYCTATWNPISGCRASCEYCYLKAMQERFGTDFMTPKVHHTRMLDVVKSKKIKPGDRIFVGSSGDTFGDWVATEDIWRVVWVSDIHPDYNFLFLTKNPKRYKEFSFEDNCWLGTTITGGTKADHKRYQDYRVATLKHKGPKFVSIEPLLGRIDVKIIETFNWVILGADSSTGATAPESGWVQEIVSYCEENNVPIWMKNNLKWENKLKQLPNM